MKKTVIASSLAVSLGIAGYALSGNEAHASETTNVDHAHLVDLAQNHPEQLNSKPVQAGAYDIHFVSNGFEYNFTSNGTNWSWNYTEAGSNTQSGSNTQASSADYTQSYNQSTSNQSVSSNQQSSNTSVKAVSAPTTSNSSSSQDYSTSTTSYSAPSTSSSSASTGGSVKAQFLANGGTEAAWEAIVMPESGGNPNATNGQYSGLGQTNQSWGTGSVASQTQGMISYANTRYGSLSNAIAFRKNHGWW